MASRQQEKERLRQERLAAERAEKARQRRRLVIGYASAGVLVALIVAGIVIAVANNGGGGTSASDVAHQTVNPDSVPAAAEQGTRTTPPPWQPLYGGLGSRLDAMGLPKLNENIYHIHAWLHVYVNGKRVTVPPNVGLDVATQTFSSMHTHNAATDAVPNLPAAAGDGIIHMEADTPYAYTLGQFFAVWGVRFTDNQLGPYKAGHGNVLQAYINGKLLNDPVNAVLHEHNDISVGYGKPGSFPKHPPVRWPAGL